MLACFLSPVPALPAQVESQVFAPELPPAARALLTANNWAGLAEWFETVPASTRGVFYMTWLESLNKSHRWERLLAVCEALQPQLEAKSGPKLGICRQLRAQALSKLSRHREAAQAFAENARLGDAVGFVGACNEARLAEDWTHLLAYAEELRQKHPRDSNCMAWKGEALLQLYRLSEAEQALQAAVEQDPADLYAWNNLGHCLNERKAWAEACAAFDKALALDPKLLESLFNRGRARFELKRYQESREDFRAALALQPNDTVIAENLRQAERYAALPPAAPPKGKKR